MSDQPTFFNIEFKARCWDLDQARAVVEGTGARLVGVDRQVDTYFHVPTGRLKLREGTIEQTLIYYERTDADGPKRSDVTLYRTGPDAVALKAVLTAALGVRVVVDKTRAIYWLDADAPVSIKLHLDRVEGLGTFVEVEVIDADGTGDPTALRARCDAFVDLLGVQPADLVAVSYSDLLLGATP